MVRWTIPPSALARGTAVYAKRLTAAVHDLGDAYAAAAETNAKQGARWADRTGNARQSLTGTAEKSPTGVTITLAGLMEYSIWLEVRNGGRFAIVMPTLRALYPELTRDLDNLVS